LSISTCLLSLVFAFILSGRLIHLESANAQNSTSTDFSAIAKKIKKTYDQNLFKLEPRVQGHYAVRMWRITADSAYLNSILFHYLALKEQFADWANNLDSEQFRLSFADSLLSEKFKTAKGKIRKQLLEKRKEFVFASELLETAYQIHTLGMDKAQLASQFQKVRNYLGSLDFKGFLLDSQIVRYYAPQAVNYIFYLKFLGVADLEKEFGEIFKQVFRDELDSKLSEIEYENKIYGLTHFIIAASDYYQNYPPPQKYAWILDYFECSAEKIMARSKPDVIAEVGLCFKLCGKKEDRVVTLTQQKILQAFDPKQGLIPPQKGKANLNKSEHRNVLAYLLLMDFERLYPGPDLLKFPQLNFLERDDSQD